MRDPAALTLEELDAVYVSPVFRVWRLTYLRAYGFNEGDERFPDWVLRSLYIQDGGLE